MRSPVEPFAGPLVSVVIPCFNAERWIGAAVDSALGQTYGSLEVIVVNDGSTDRSSEILHGYRERIRLIERPNQGPCAARNTGMCAARGVWIQFLDSDDLLDPLKVELSIRAGKACPQARYIYADYRIIDQNFTLRTGPNDTDFLCTTTVSDNGFDAPYAPWAAMFQKSFLTEVGFWNESLRRWVDLEYHSRIICSKVPYARIARELYYYRSHDGTRISTSKMNRAGIERALASLTITRSNFEKSALDKHACEDYLWRFYLVLARAALGDGDRSLFSKLIREADKLRKSSKFTLRRQAAEVLCGLFGARATKALLDKALGSN